MRSSLQEPRASVRSRRYIKHVGGTPQRHTQFNQLSVFP